MMNRTVLAFFVPLLALAAFFAPGCAGTRRALDAGTGTPDTRTFLLEGAGRVFVLPLVTPRLGEKEIAIARRIRPAGYLVLAGAVESRTQFLSLMRSVRGIDPYGKVRIMIDEEGGRVSRLIPLYGRTASQRERGLEADTNAERRFAASNARRLRSLGIDMVLAPVADVLFEKESRVLKDRAFGGDPGLVSRMVSASLRGYADEKFDCVLKHFPGHGSVSGDTHKEGPVLTKPYADLEAKDLLPYRRAAAEGLPFSIMMSHLVWSGIDPESPASVSFSAIRQARQIPGFQGLILTDDLAMAAVTNRIALRDTAVRAVAAGADLLLYSSDWELVLTAWSNLRTRIEENPDFADVMRDCLTRRWEPVGQKRPK